MAEAATAPPIMRPCKVPSFLTKPRIAVLHWITPHGDPMATPVWYRYRDGRFQIYTTRRTAKARAIERCDRVCVCVQDPGPPQRYVTIRGRATINGDGAAALRLYRELARTYLGRLGSWFFLRLARTSEDGDIIIEVTPTTVITLDGTEGVHPLALAVWRVLRRIPGL